MGALYYRESGKDISQAAFVAARQADAILMGAMGWPDVRYPDGTEISPHLKLREEFQLYAGVRPVMLPRAILSIWTTRSFRRTTGRMRPGAPFAEELAAELQPLVARPGGGGRRRIRSPFLGRRRPASTRAAPAGLPHAGKSSAGAFAALAQAGPRRAVPSKSRGDLADRYSAYRDGAHEVVSRRSSGRRRSQGVGAAAGAGNQWRRRSPTRQDRALRSGASVRSHPDRRRARASANPRSAPILHAMGSLGVEARETWMVGDDLGVGGGGAATARHLRDLVRCDRRGFAARDDRQTGPHHSLAVRAAAGDGSRRACGPPASATRSVDLTTGCAHDEHFLMLPPPLTPPRQAGRGTTSRSGMGTPSCPTRCGHAR